MPYDYVPYGTNTKIDCPSCGHKKKFTLFMDLDSGEVMPPEFGRCDREEKCGYYKHPLSDQPTTGIKYEPKPKAPQQYIDKSIVSQSMEFNKFNKFLLLLKENFGGEKVEEAIKKYYIGTSKSGGVGYYCINHKKLVTSCKVVIYKDFNRDKERMPYYPFKTSDGYYPCLFGLHLVDKDKKLKLVEAEKTAFIASIVYPDVVWISCGGKNNLTSDKCQLLKETKYPHPIDLIPDCDEGGRNAAVEKWQRNLSVHGMKSNIVDLGSQYNDSEDVADLILKNI